MTCEAGLSVRLAAWRKAQGWTQEAAAKAVGIPHRTWVGYENSERQPGANALAGLVRAGCDVAWLLVGDRGARSALLGYEAPTPMMAIGQIAQALGTTKRSAERRAVLDGWSFREQTCRGGRRRMYPLDQLPADVRDQLIRARPVAIEPQSASRQIPRGRRFASGGDWELLVVAAALIASVMTVVL